MVDNQMSPRVIMFKIVNKEGLKIKRSMAVISSKNINGKTIKEMDLT